MSLRQAIKGLIVVVAVMFGASASAFAHAGHAHAQLPATSGAESTNYSSATPEITIEFSGVFAPSLPTRSNAPVSSAELIQSSALPTGSAACPPGACCCQGASMCGMSGHCCTSMMPDDDWAKDLSNHMRYHLPRISSVYPDIAIGLDRPPKA